MPGELGAVVKDHRTAPFGGERGQQPGHGLGDWFRRLAWYPDGSQQAGMPLLHDQKGLPMVAEEHQVGLPVSRRGAVIGLLSTLGQGAAVGDERGRAAAFAAPPAPLGLGLGKVVTPVIVLGTGQLGIDEAVDGLVGNDGTPGFQSKASGHLLGRPTLVETGEDLFPQQGVPVQTGALPAAGAGLLLGVGGPVTLGLGAVSPQLSSHC